MPPFLEVFLVNMVQLEDIQLNYHQMKMYHIFSYGQAQ